MRDQGIYISIFALRQIGITTETNQPLTEETVQKVYEETLGQLWLVKYLGTILTVDIKPGTVEPIDVKDMEKAMDILLLWRNDHFDNICEKVPLYKNSFIEVIFSKVEYDLGYRKLDYLEQCGFIKNCNGSANGRNKFWKNFFSQKQGED